MPEREDGYYWVKWKEGYNWEVGELTTAYNPNDWLATGTEIVQDEPFLVGPKIERPLIKEEGK